MDSDYKDDKINENAITKCNKCECLILSDSSEPDNDKCIKSRHNQGNTYDGEKLILKSGCHSTVKIFVKQQCDDDSSSQSVEKGTSTEECVCEDQDGEDGTMKHICFRFYKKNKKCKARGSNGSIKDEMNQTSHPGMNDGKTQMSPEEVDELVAKTLCNCTKSAHRKNGGGGGCNTNTIIIPRESSAGDGVANLENIIKTEARLNNRSLEDILLEIQKQRREILDVKDMLDVVVRGLRDNLLVTTFAKNQADLLNDMNRRNRCFISF